MPQGAAVAIDSAVPRREDAASPAPMGDAVYPGLAAAMNIIDLVWPSIQLLLPLVTSRSIAFASHLVYLAGWQPTRARRAHLVAAPM